MAASKAVIQEALETLTADPKWAAAIYDVRFSDVLDLLDELVEVEYVFEADSAKAEQ